MKKVLNVILTFLLLNLICILVISINLKTIIIDGVIKEVIKTEIVNNDYKEPNTISSEDIKEITSDPKIQEILNSPEIQELINKYLDITINGILDEDDLNDVKLEQDIYDYIKENKEVIEEKANVKIDDETIEKVKEMKEAKQLSRKFINTIKSKKNSITKTEKVVLKGYKTFTSIGFQLIVLGIILVDLLVIGLINKSIIKVIKELGIASIISGIFTSIMCIVVKIIVINNSVLKTFHMRNLLISSIGVIIIGILLMIIYKRLDKKISFRMK